MTTPLLGRGYMDSITIDYDIRSTTTKHTYSTSGTKNDNVISFIDPNEEQHTLTLYDTTMLYRKEGEATMVFTFDPSTTTTGTYETMGHTFQFEVHTTTYSHSNHQIRVEYDLYQQNNAIGHTILSIDYHLNKEE